MSLSVVAIVGRSNVGKSTLFNCLTRSRQALVADYSGLTRDRQYGFGKVGDKPYMLVDTGGLIDQAEGLEKLMQEQVQIAIDEASLVLLVVDAAAGLNASDQQLAQQFRRLNKPLILVMNKSDKTGAARLVGEFASLGYGQSILISAAHRRGIRLLAQMFCDWLPSAPIITTETRELIKVAVIGKPNVGKSTLINQLSNSNRVLATDLAGTTRDSIRIPIEINQQPYEFIDTAGIRRRKKVHQTVEKFSIIKALDAIHQCHLVLLMLDATENLSDQDLSIANLAISEGRGIVILFNKWDCLDDKQKKHFLDDWQRRAQFLDFAKQLKISALKGTGTKAIVAAISQAYKACFSKLKTADLNHILQAATEHKKPQSKGHQAVKLRYAHLGGSNPPSIIIHGNSCHLLTAGYKRYLENTFRKAFDLYGTPIRLIFKTTANPFAKSKSRSQRPKRHPVKPLKKNPR